ncbi:hypothetical protein FQN54_003466 [Arachnomyces sp. PD_36]|nr:hypothetical protein FQN54_003466 [Arachnomyces sp. PD_36]
MATNYAYLNNSGGGGSGLGIYSPSGSSTSLPSRLMDKLPPFIRDRTAQFGTQVGSWSPRRIGGIGDFRRGGIRTIRRMFRIPNLLIFLWLFTLWWGERLVFRQSIEDCDWGGWEEWPQEASPHHVVFIADPQLVDPHTYPGRPWPLSSLTVFYTDLYMLRVHSLLERKLRPDTLFFLGDLFDGGREWSTATSTSPELRYREYGDEFWLHEYDRFSKIFFDRWKEGDGPETKAGNRKMIASLPGNHDIGFGNGIQEPVHRRFRAFFGDGNRVDVVGNHSFVSVDTVALSSMEQPDPKTGSSGMGAGDGAKPNENIWAFAKAFLDGVKERKGRVAREELRALDAQNGASYTPFDDEEETATGKNKPGPQLPTILLTHVPLYRAPGTPCGPLRERFPPSSTNPLPEKDDRNAISVSGGYQYQNVLSTTVSNQLISKIGDITHIYSGDDHDYCEINHREFSGSPKEITVKSLSWAMGVRRPGFQLTSLWNPVDIDTGKPLQGGGGAEGSSGATLQNHLCLLPDQLAIFIRYGYVFGFTITMLILYTLPLVIYPSETARVDPLPLLPMFNKPSTASSSSTNPTRTRSRANSRIASRGSPPFLDRIPELVSTSSTSAHSGDDANQKGRARSRTQTQIDFRRTAGFRGQVVAAMREFGRSMLKVAGVAMAWYLWLLWRW